MLIDLGKNYYTGYWEKFKNEEGLYDGNAILQHIYDLHDGRAEKPFGKYGGPTLDYSGREFEDKRCKVCGRWYCIKKPEYKKTNKDTAFIIDEFDLEGNIRFKWYDLCEQCGAWLDLIFAEKGEIEYERTGKLLRYGKKNSLQ